jgi:hypothetical protein
MQSGTKRKEEEAEESRLWLSENGKGPGQGLGPLLLDKMEQLHAVLYVLRSSDAT